MLKVLDNEGELLVTLTDVVDKEDLEARIAKEDQALVETLGDTPFWSRPLDESPFSDDPPVEEVTQTYAEWMTGCLKWAREANGG